MYASASSGMANMYSGSLGRRELRETGRREQLEDMMHVEELEAASVTHQGIPSLTRTAYTYHINRGETSAVTGCMR